MGNNKLINIRKMLANESHAYSIPIDFEGLIEQGILKKVGKSYYVDDLNSLPESIRKRINTFSARCSSGGGSRCAALFPVAAGFRRRAARSRRRA